MTFCWHIFELQLRRKVKFGGLKIEKQKSVCFRCGNNFIPQI